MVLCGTGLLLKPHKDPITQRENVMREVGGRLVYWVDANHVSLSFLLRKVIARFRAFLGELNTMQVKHIKHVDHSRHQNTKDQKRKTGENFQKSSLSRNKRVPSKLEGRSNYVKYIK